MTNLIFIDIDGVLNSFHFYQITPHYTWNLFDPNCVRLLNDLIKINNAKLVLISDWRKTYGIKKVKEVFKKNKIEGTIVGYIPTEHNKKVGIQLFLDNLKTNLRNINYAIVDDSNDFFSNQIRHLIQINPEFGLTLKDHARIDKLLNYNR